MFTLMVRSDKIGFRWYQAANLESLLLRMQWDRDQPGLAYMHEELAFVMAVVANRPQGYLEEHGYNIGCMEKSTGKYYDIHLDTGTGKYWETYSKGREIIVEPPKSYIPTTGLYHGKTLYGEPIFNNATSLEEAERLIREHQKATNNKMCGIVHEKVVTQHLKTVDPYHEESTHPGRRDAEVHQVAPGTDSTGIRNDSTQDSGAMCATGPEPGCEPPPDKDGGRQEGIGDGGGRSTPAGAD
jgi:hypothetical protein